MDFHVVSSFTIYDELGTASTVFFMIWHFSLFTLMMYPSKKIIPGQIFWDIKHLNDRMHEVTYVWQSQAPVSINSCLTIEYLLKECITEKVPCDIENFKS